MPNGKKKLPIFDLPEAPVEPTVYVPPAERVTEQERIGTPVGTQDIKLLADIMAGAGDDSAFKPRGEVIAGKGVVTERPRGAVRDTVRKGAEGAEKEGFDIGEFWGGLDPRLKLGALLLAGRAIAGQEAVRPGGPGPQAIGDYGQFAVGAVEAQTKRLRQLEEDKLKREQLQVERAPKPPKPPKPGALTDVEKTYATFIKSMEEKPEFYSKRDETLARMYPSEQLKGMSQEERNQAFYDVQYPEIGRFYRGWARGLPLKGAKKAVPVLGPKGKKPKAGKGTVSMISPDGRTLQVPADKVGEMEKAGAKRA